MAARKFNSTWTERDWTPVRREGVYCSPACGGGSATCTVSAYECAVDAANKVARDLGPGWSPVVTENLGWHARVASLCGRISVCIPILPRDHNYQAFLGPKELQPGGKWAESGRTAREAIGNVLNAARRDLGLIEGTIAGLEIPRLPMTRRRGHPKPSPASATSAAPGAVTPAKREG